MNKWIVIGVVILILIASLSLFLIFPQQSENKLNDSLLEKCRNEPSQSSIDSCLKSLAMANNDASICAQMSENKPQPNTRDSCYSQIAFQTNDISSCYNIDEISEKDSCFNVVARKKLNGELCGEMSSSVKLESTGIPERDYCYIDIAISTKNPSLCDKIITPDSNIFWNKQKCRDATQKN